jgi:hypothetical protein
MSMPGFTAEASLGRTSEYNQTMEGFFPWADDTAVLPQFCVNGPCLRLPSGRFCITLPILGRRCVTIPSLGRWRVRCCTHIFPPGISCGIRRC